MSLKRTKLRKEMLLYKRRNQRFDARVNRIKRYSTHLAQSPLVDNTGKQFGFVIRFKENGLNNYITSYELMHLDSAGFNRKLSGRAIG